jgi:hypothetical protein
MSGQVRLVFMPGFQEFRQYPPLAVFQKTFYLFGIRIFFAVEEKKIKMVKVGDEGSDDGYGDPSDVKLLPNFPQKPCPYKPQKHMVKSVPGMP